MPDRGGIQLLPETRKKIEVNVPGENRLVYIGSALLIVVIGLFVVLNGMTNTLEKQIKDKNAQLVQLNTSRDKEIEGQLSALSKQTALIKNFLDSHVFWTNALGKVQQALQQQVEISLLSGNLVSHEISLSALAPDFTTIARQIASFTADDGIKDVEVSNAKSDNGGKYGFTIKIIFDPEKYLKK